MLNVIAAISVVPAGVAFDCTPIAVWDGDGPVWCEEGPHLRLSGIAARELDGTCRADHPCPARPGPDARDALVQLIGRAAGVGPHGHILVVANTMRCVSTGPAGGTRTAAWCISPKAGDLSCAMVRYGHAERWDRYWKGHVCR